MEDGLSCGHNSQTVVYIYAVLSDGAVTFTSVTYSPFMRHISLWEFSHYQWSSF